MLNVIKLSFENRKKYSRAISAFSCGNLFIDNFLESTDSCNPSVCKTYLLIDELDKEEFNLIGYYSLSTDAVSESSNGILRFNGGAIRISMFAIDKRYQGKRLCFEQKEQTLASFLLIHCLKEIRAIAQNNVGAMYIVLNSTQEGYNLYTNTGEFEPFDEDLLTLHHEDDGKESIGMYKTLFDLEEF